MTVQLYYFQPLGTNSSRVYLALLEKGVDFIEHELSGRDFEHLRPDYLAVNPKGQVPTLVHDGIALPEGMIINEYALPNLAAGVLSDCISTNHQMTL